jgi:putative FmdB family regulatory protein
MPLYEYKCGSCGDVFEVIQKFSDEPLHEHPGCGGSVEKLISAAALQFKGSGWYVNDYGRNNSGSREKSKNEASDGKSSEGKSSDAKSSEGKSDAKSSDGKSSDSARNGGSKAVATPDTGASSAAKSDK